MTSASTPIPAAHVAASNNDSTRCQWDVDITVQTTPLSTTGGHTWPAARHLLRYLEHCYATDTHAMQSNTALRVLELGSGCGWLGIVLAKNLPTARVCVTEQATGGALAWLEHNVRRVGLPNLWAAPCDWTMALHDHPGPRPTSGKAACAAHPGHQHEHCTSPDSEATHAVDSVISQQWDLIIGSDLVYNEAGTQWLPRVLAALLQQTPCAIYCHTKHRYDLLDMDFFAALEATGVTCHEVLIPGDDSPPPSPPLCFPGELFGEQRIAVFLLTRSR